MAINISLYQITDAENVVPKALGTAVSTHTVTLKDGCSIDRPTVSFSGGAALLATVNYAYIDAFGRYYWIRDRNMTVNGVCEITLESDHLQSFYTELSNAPATITRSASEYNGYLMDSGYNAVAYEGVQYKRFPNALNDATCVLVTVG